MVHILIFLLSVFVSSLSQILLKKSADVDHENVIKEYLNIRVIFAYGLFLVATLITVIAYKNVSLALGAVLESSGYIFVTILGKLVLKEHISKRKVLGLFIIIMGIIIFNIK